MRLSRGFVFLLILTHAGCGSGSSSVPTAPSAPSPVPQPIPQPGDQFVVFGDPASGSYISDVRDVHDQIVRFSTTGELIWTADGTRFPGFPVRPACSVTTGNRCTSSHPNSVGQTGYYQVRFATREGERRAYFCGHGHDDISDPPPITDIEVAGGQLIITEIAMLCPGVGE